MQNESEKTNKINEGLWRKIAVIAGIFSFVICILLVANYIQIKKADPVNMKVINALVDRLNQNPSDSQLRDEIRTLDLLSRKAYFTNQWQIRTGGYLMLFGIALMVIALQVISLSKKKEAILPTQVAENTALSDKNAQKWVIISGISLLSLALLFAFLSQNELKKKFADAAIAANSQTESEGGTKDLNASESASSVADTSSTGVDNGVPNQGENPKSGVDSTKATAVTDSKDNFPTFRGQGGYGIARQKNIPVKWNGKTGENVLWKLTLPLSGANSPVIWGDKLFLTGASATKREVYCIDRNTGKLVWTVPVEKIAGSPGQSPKVSGETGFSAPTAATDGKAVYAVFANGDMVAIDMNGKQLWGQNLGDAQNHYGHSSSLMMYKDLVIVQYDQRNAPKLMALSAATGKTVWSTARKVKISWASPIIVNTGKRSEIIVVAEPYVASYNPSNGEELWKIDCISGEVGPSLAYANGMVFSVNDYSKLSAIKLGDQPKVLWENTDFLSDVPSPVATDKCLFLTTSYGTVVCYDTQTGNKNWEKEFNNSVYSSPVIAEGKVYLLDRTGLMHIFKADKEFLSLGEPALGEKTVSTPAFSNGRIYLRGEKNLYCIGK
jgi:outer membrane protein assembly factor BamB/uncharacterized protein YneF (UPF0154 family)